MPAKKIYISGALTDIKNVTEIKAFYEAIGRVCGEVGCQAYVPHLNTDPIANPDLSPREVFETDKHQVTNSDLVIAYLGYPSFGVGMELAYAEVNAIPVILMYERGKKVSRFPRGLPTVIYEIQFDDCEEALTKLKSFLENYDRDGF